MNYPAINVIPIKYGEITILIPLQDMHLIDNLINKNIDFAIVTYTNELIEVIEKRGQIISNATKCRKTDEWTSLK